MKKKSNKLRKLERSRFSIITDDLTRCYCCGDKAVDLNEIYEGAKRIASIKNGMVVPLCRMDHIRFHNDRGFALQFKMLGQLTFEKNHSRQEFINIFKRSYLP